MNRMPATEDVEQALQSNWIWISNFRDESTISSGALISFTRRFSLDAHPRKANIFCTADTRYKLTVNGHRVGVGPTRSCAQIWYYDERSILLYLTPGENTITFDVLRMYPAGRTGFSLPRTRLPGLTVSGSVALANGTEIDVSTRTSTWEAVWRKDLYFPFGLDDDFFLHTYERYTAGTSTRSPPNAAGHAFPYALNLNTGEMTPWNLSPRIIPFHEESSAQMIGVIWSQTSAPIGQWSDFTKGSAIRLPPNSRHQIHLQSAEHTTAFIRWAFGPYSQGSRISIEYSEGYEDSPQSYPWLRRKGNRTDSMGGKLFGPCDVVLISSEHRNIVEYEPFWYRTFRFIALDVEAGPSGLSIQMASIKQVNYPLALKAAWRQRNVDRENEIWEVSVRTLRNCIFDGYSDCPFYEQLQSVKGLADVPSRSDFSRYAMDTRSSGLFHYLLSGDDRLMRQAIRAFAVSATEDGLIQARYPSHVGQIIPGFSLFWILQVCDHHMYFSDAAFSKRFLPVIQRVVDFFANFVDHRGLISGLPRKFWQFVDWTEEWRGTPEHPDGGVPLDGRRTNTHTVLSALFAFTLCEAGKTLRSLGKCATAQEFDALACTLRTAINKHCFNGQVYTDSTTDQASGGFSQHAQVMAVLSGAASPATASQVLHAAFLSPAPTSATFARCSYVYMHYAFRAFNRAGFDLYNKFWRIAWNPWRGMLDKNLTTWEEDSITQRSDCHAWGSVPIYEYATEVAGLQCLEPGWTSLLFAPRVSLAENLDCTIALGRNNTARVTWTSVDGLLQVDLHLARAIHVVSSFPECGIRDHGHVSALQFHLPGLG